MPAPRKPSPSSPATDPAPAARQPAAPAITRAEALRWWRAGYQAGQASRRTRAPRRRPVGPAHRRIPRPARQRPASQARRAPARGHRRARQPLQRRPQQPPGLTAPPALHHHQDPAGTCTSNAAKPCANNVADNTPAILLRESYPGRRGQEPDPGQPVGLARGQGRRADPGAEGHPAARRRLDGAFEITRSLPHALAAVLGAARQLGLDELMNPVPSRQRDLVTAMAAAR